MKLKPNQPNATAQQVGIKECSTHRAIVVARVKCRSNMIQIFCLAVFHCKLNRCLITRVAGSLRRHFLL